jgi:hypothetical protein
VDVAAALEAIVHHTLVAFHPFFPLPLIDSVALDRTSSLLCSVLPLPLTRPDASITAGVLNTTLLPAHPLVRARFRNLQVVNIALAARVPALCCIIAARQVHQPRRLLDGKGA